MIIHEPEIIHKDGEALLSARIEIDSQADVFPKWLWFAYPECFQAMISLRADPFLCALLLVAQSLGEDLRLMGEASPRLLYGMNEYQQIFHHWDHSLYKRIHITAEKVSKAPLPVVKNQYIAPFSGGVDSFFTLREGLLPQAGQAGWRLTHGLFMHGSPDIALAYTDKFHILAERYKRLYQELGLELITARTNLMQFSAQHVPFESFLEAPLAGCAMALSPVFSGLIIPSGEIYRHYRLTATGPLTTQLNATENFETQASGCAFSRLEKVKAISDWEPVQKHLRVCLGFDAASKKNSENCSRCSKCMRTRMDLHILGRLDEMEMLAHPFTLRDYLRWGRWLEIGHGWEANVWNYCRKQRPELLPMIALGLAIGYARETLKKILPGPVKKWIFRYTSAPDPHIQHKAGLPEDADILFEEHGL